MSKNLINNYNILQNKYPNELNGYKFVLPDNRNNLNPGVLIKYININYEKSPDKYKLRSGFLVSYDNDFIILKSTVTNSKFVFKLKFNNHYIFYFNHYDKLRAFLEDNYDFIIKEKDKGEIDKSKDKHNLETESFNIRNKYFNKNK